jgi:hypothetical protein
MIRVRDMSRLRLDNSGQNLSASVTFVASFQKKSKVVSAGGGSSGVSNPKTASPGSGSKAPGPTAPGKPKTSTNAAATPRVTGTNAPTKK